jgi:hypothetical protein
MAVDPRGRAGEAIKRFKAWLITHERQIAATVALIAGGYMAGMRGCEMEFRHDGDRPYRAVRCFVFRGGSGHTRQVAEHGRCVANSQAAPGIAFIG